ncbi:MAG: hypothetical protein IJT30_04135 [Muribaculaceae bacterium]|nr:hypothetical protein [Muribaculaceae bacterium]
MKNFDLETHKEINWKKDGNYGHNLGQSSACRPNEKPYHKFSETDKGVDSPPEFAIHYCTLAEKLHKTAFLLNILNELHYICFFKKTH